MANLKSRFKRLAQESGKKVSKHGKRFAGGAKRELEEALGLSSAQRERRKIARAAFEEELSKAELKSAKRRARMIVQQRLEREFGDQRAQKQQLASEFEFGQETAGLRSPRGGFDIVFGGSDQLNGFGNMGSMDFAGFGLPTKKSRRK